MRLPHPLVCTLGPIGMQMLLLDGTGDIRQPHQPSGAIHMM
ncbi:hypothetical protein [Bradyrhizobium pachyrhizi]